MLKFIDNEDTQLLTQLVNMNALRKLSTENRIVLIGGYITVSFGAEVSVLTGAIALDRDKIWLSTNDFLIDVSGEELTYPEKNNEIYLATATWTFDSWVGQLS